MTDSKSSRISIVCAADCSPCPDCGEPFCKKHKKHYADCECVGPHNADELGYDVIEEDGKLVGVKRVDG